jgi:hypothetical protein
MLYLEKELLSKVAYDNIKFSLECRGKKITNATKMEMVEELYHDVVRFRPPAMFYFIPPRFVPVCCSLLTSNNFVDISIHYLTSH